MKYVPIDFGGPRKLGFDVTSARLATTSIQAYLPPGSAKLNLAGAIMLALSGDYDAVVVFLLHGLSHGDRKLTQQKINDLLGAELSAKRQTLGDVSILILDALVANGLAERKKDEDDDSKGTEEASATPPLRAVE